MKTLLWCVFALWLLTFLFGRYRNPNLRVTLLDVGQGDSILIQYPGFQTQLIDSGATKREVFLDLAARGILTVNWALLTHPDQDHGLGFIDLFSNIKIGEFWIHSAHLLSDKPLMKNILKAVREKSKLVAYEKNTPLNIAGTRVTLFPIAEKKLNDLSLVQLLEYAGCRFLFTGDIEKASEEKLLLQILGKIDFLKVAHHGSHSSSIPTLVKKLNPRFALVSVGKQNKYGHPHLDVLHRFEQAGAEILRTDTHGYLSIEVNSEGFYRCNSFAGPCGTGYCTTRR